MTIMTHKIKLYNNYKINFLLNNTPPFRNTRNKLQFKIEDYTLDVDAYKKLKSLYNSVFIYYIPQFIQDSTIDTNTEKNIDKVYKIIKIFKTKLYEIYNALHNIPSYNKISTNTISEILSKNTQNEYSTLTRMTIHTSINLLNNILYKKLITIMINPINFCDIFYINTQKVANLDTSDIDINKILVHETPITEAYHNIIKILDSIFICYNNDIKAKYDDLQTDETCKNRLNAKIKRDTQIYKALYLQNIFKLYNIISSKYYNFKYDMQNFMNNKMYEIHENTNTYIFCYTLYDEIINLDINQTKLSKKIVNIFNYYALNIQYNYINIIRKKQNNINEYYNDTIKQNSKILLYVKERIDTYLSTNNVNPRYIFTPHPIIYTSESPKLIKYYKLNLEYFNYYNKYNNTENYNLEYEKTFISDNSDYIEKYYLGNINGYYQYNMTPENIINNVECGGVIINKLTNLENIIIFGIGQSGSGKTSFLINYNQTPGIIIHILNKLGEVTQELNYFNIIELSGYSVYIKDTNTINIIDSFEDTNYNVNPVIINKKLITTFTYNNKIWKTNTGEQLINIIMSIFQQNDNIDVTKNNISSSRSHIICKIKLINNVNNINVHIILCDLAGVEDTFTCNVNELELLKNKYIEKATEKQITDLSNLMNSDIHKYETKHSNNIYIESDDKIYKECIQILIKIKDHNIENCNLIYNNSKHLVSKSIILNTLITEDTFKKSCTQIITQKLNTLSINYTDNKIPEIINEIYTTIYTNIEINNPNNTDINLEFTKSIPINDYFNNVYEKYNTINVEKYNDFKFNDDVEITIEHNKLNNIINIDANDTITSELTNIQTEINTITQLMNLYEEIDACEFNILYYYSLYVLIIYLYKNERSPNTLYTDKSKFKLFNKELRSNYKSDFIPNAKLLFNISSISNLKQFDLINIPETTPIYEIINNDIFTYIKDNINSIYINTTDQIQIQTPDNIIRSEYYNITDPESKYKINTKKYATLKLSIDEIKHITKIFSLPQYKFKDDNMGKVIELFYVIIPNINVDKIWYNNTTKEFILCEIITHVLNINNSIGFTVSNISTNVNKKIIFTTINADTIYKHNIQNLLYLIRYIYILHKKKYTSIVYFYKYILLILYKYKYIYMYILKLVNSTSSITITDYIINIIPDENNQYYNTIKDLDDSIKNLDDSIKDLDDSINAENTVNDTTIYNKEYTLVLNINNNVIERLCSSGLYNKRALHTIIDEMISKYNISITEIITSINTNIELNISNQTQHENALYTKNIELIKTTYITKYTNDLNDYCNKYVEFINNKFNYGTNIDKHFTELLQLYKLCQVRKKEGYMINTSLLSMQKTINNLLLNTLSTTFSNNIKNNNLQTIPNSTLVIPLDTIHNMSEHTSQSSRIDILNYNNFNTYNKEITNIIKYIILCIHIMIYDDTKFRSINKTHLHTIIKNKCNALKNKVEDYFYFMINHINHTINTVQSVPNLHIGILNAYFCLTNLLIVLFFNNENDLNSKMINMDDIYNKLISVVFNKDFYNNQNTNLNTLFKLNKELSHYIEKKIYITSFLRQIQNEEERSFINKFNDIFKNYYSTNETKTQNDYIIYLIMWYYTLNNNCYNINYVNYNLETIKYIINILLNLDDTKLTQLDDTELIQLDDTESTIHLNTYVQYDSNNNIVNITINEEDIVLQNLNIDAFILENFKNTILVFIDKFYLYLNNINSDINILKYLYTYLFNIFNIINKYTNSCTTQFNDIITPHIQTITPLLYYNDFMDKQCNNITMNTNYYKNYYFNNNEIEVTNKDIIFKIIKDQSIDLFNTSIVIFSVINLTPPYNELNISNPPNPPYININKIKLIYKILNSKFYKSLVNNNNEIKIKLDRKFTIALSNLYNKLIQYNYYSSLFNNELVPLNTESFPLNTESLTIFTINIVDFKKIIDIIDINNTLSLIGTVNFNNFIQIRDINNDTLFICDNNFNQTYTELVQLENINNILDINKIYINYPTPLDANIIYNIPSNTSSYRQNIESNDASKRQKKKSDDASDIQNIESDDASKRQKKKLGEVGFYHSKKMLNL